MLICSCGNELSSSESQLSGIVHRSKDIDGEKNHDVKRGCLSRSVFPPFSHCPTSDYRNRRRSPSTVTTETLRLNDNVDATSDLCRACVLSEQDLT